MGSVLTGFSRPEWVPINQTRAGGQRFNNHQGCDLP